MSMMIHFVTLFSIWLHCYLIMSEWVHLQIYNCNVIHVCNHHLEEHEHYVREWFFYLSFMMTSLNRAVFRVTGPLCRWPVNSPHKGQWRGASMFSLVCAWTNGWVNHRDAGDLKRHRAHYDFTVVTTEMIRETCSETTASAWTMHVL